MPPSDSPRFSQLSASRQALVRLCQSTNYGHIRYLTVRDHEPVFSDDCLVLVDVKLNSEENSHQGANQDDFFLCAEIVRLMALLDTISQSKISELEIRAGIPRRIVLEHPSTEFVGVST